MTMTRTKIRGRPNLESLLDQAERKGVAKVKAKNGRTFVIRPERRKRSPLDVKGVDLRVTTAEIIQFIQEGRKIG
ncbi:MAG: type II toxin-antitoxin system Phd/YefM family antitoxin [Chloroflexi bacterium]|nr:type II toxin-antitoxin system Phd/YefM family antitoxin [Chloroflexota bacterium]